MSELNLSEEGRVVLLETLQVSLSNLRYEIADTDTYDYKQQLKSRKALLQDIVGKLEV
jgi:hypothetical protein